MNPVFAQPSSHTGAVFATTRWTQVLEAGGGGEIAQQTALAALCQTYWPPVYAYIRRFGASPADAQDQAQEFFGRLLAREFFSRAEPDKGRFRTFLLCSLKNFLHDEHHRSHARKRGGGQVVSLDELVAEEAYLAEPTDGVTAEILFERKWALTLLEGVLAQLEAEFNQGARPGLFAELRQRLWGGNRGEPAHLLAQRFGLSETAVHVMMHRLRTRFRERLRAEIAELVSSPAEIDDEIAHLIRVLGSPA
jgi:RNA polymerase sigma-70 factor (ECF subfamily)